MICDDVEVYTSSVYTIRHVQIMTVMHTGSTLFAFTLNAH